MLLSTIVAGGVSYARSNSAGAPGDFWSVKKPTPLLKWRSASFCSGVFSALSAGGFFLFFGAACTAVAANKHPTTIVVRLINRGFRSRSCLDVSSAAAADDL